MKLVDFEKSIRAIVGTAVETFASTFCERHLSEIENPDGTINMKIHNVFISVLGEEIQYYTALVRSLDSSLGNMLESMAMKIAEISYKVHKSVEGHLTLKQTQDIAELLEQYKRRTKIPEITDYQLLRKSNYNNSDQIKRHDSDYYLIDEETNSHYLIELKIGGDLDNKKARSEKEAILEQFAILSNTLPKNSNIKCFFATAYNRYGENKEWKQERVKQFFAKDELLIGKDFWNFICKDDKGYNLIMEELNKYNPLVISALRIVCKKYNLAA